MRKVILPLYSFFLLPFLIHAQPESDNLQSKGYLFEHFIQGSVLLKSHEIEYARLNYDSNNQNIAFEKDGQYLILTNLENVDTIFIEDKKFVPVNNKVYEIATTTPIALYISYKGKPHSVSATTDHNGTSRKTNKEVSNTISDVYLTRRFQRDVEFEVIKEYWLVRGNSFYKANSEKQIIKVFPSKANVISQFIKNNKVDFSNRNDMINLINFCNEKKV